MSVPGPSDEDLPAELEIADPILFEVDLQSGWPVAIQQECVMTIADQSRVESAEIEIISE